MNVVTPLVTLGRKLLEIGRIQDPQRRRYYLDAYDQAPVGKPGGGGVCSPYNMFHLMRLSADVRLVQRATWTPV